MKCEICGKSVSFGHNVSHSNRKTQRTYKPNIRRIRVVENGTPKTVYVCARCLRSNKVQRAELKIKAAAQTENVTVETIEDVIVDAEAPAEEIAEAVEAAAEAVEPAEAE